MFEACWEHGCVVMRWLILSEIRSLVACQNKYSGNICHARNRGPNRFFTTKRRKSKRGGVRRNIATCCLINNKLFKNMANCKYFKTTLKTQNYIHEEVKNRVYPGNACCVVSFSSECRTHPSVF